MTTAAAPARRTLLAMLLAALCASSTLPPCSRADQQKPATAKKDRSPPSSRLPEPLAVDIGRSSSAVFPLRGNVYPDGLYFALLSIGDPPKPYFLDVDTGSDLTWLQCDAPCVSCSKGPHPLYKPTKDKLVPCEHPICASLQTATAKVQQHPCASPKDQCDYEVEYADHGSSRGVLISDSFSMRFVNGSLVRPRLAFGCGYDQQPYGAGSLSPTDGVLGLGFGRSSVLSQLREQGLRNVMGHCLSQKGGGFLFFGDDLVPHSRITWTPMSRRVSGKHYSPGPANLYFGGHLFGRNFQAVFDSGSSYTYFSSRPYQACLQMKWKKRRELHVASHLHVNRPNVACGGATSTQVLKDLTGKPLKEAPEDLTLSRCWKGAKPFKSVADVGKYFKTLTLVFPQGKSAQRAQLDVPPEGYLIVTKYGNVCLGILDGSQIGLHDLNIIGDISLQDLMVIYDNEEGQIGWTRENCHRLPNAHPEDGFEEDSCWTHWADLGGVLTPAYAASYDSSTT